MPCNPSSAWGQEMLGLVERRERTLNIQVKVLPKMFE